MCIEYKREFELSEKEVAKIVKHYGNLSINANISLDLNNIQKHLSYIPIKSNSNLFEFSHPLGEIKKLSKTYEVYIGNKKITTLRPEYFKISKNCDENLTFEVDGAIIHTPKASEIYINDDFKVLTSQNHRVNIIGFQKKGFKDESNLTITLQDLDKRFSVDNDNRVYRVELYNDEEFCSMTMVHFK